MRKEPNSLWTGIVISFVLHAVLLAGLLLVDVQPDKPKKIEVKPAPIQAVVVDQARVDAQVKRLKAEKAKQEKAERDRIKKLQDEARKAEQKRKAEQQRLKRIQREKEQEKKRAAEAKRKKEAEQKKAAEAEKLRKQKEAERKKAEKAAAEAKRKAEAEAAERKRKEEARKEAERLRKEQEAMEQAMAEALAEEQAVLNRQRQQQVLSEVDKYTALIRATIQRNWNVDESMAGQSCQLTIKLASDGFVTSVDQGVGDIPVCNSARQAVLKAGTLPMSPEPEVASQLRVIKLTMEPNF